MSLKTNILQLLRRGTAAAPRQGSSLGTASPQAWECTFCTYLHSEEELDYLACKLCQAVRVEALASGEAPPGSLADPGPAPATAQSGAAAAPRKRKLAAADDTAPRAASAAAPRAASVAAHQAASAAAPRAASAAAPRAASAATPGRDAFADLMRAEARRSTKWAFRASRDAAGVLTADFVPEADGAAGRGRRVYSAPTRRLKVGTSFECQVSLSLDDASDGNDARWAPCAAAYDGAANAGGLSMLQSHMQKCVRRGLSDLAVRSARELASISFGPEKLVGVEMLLRRLPIIAVEDVGDCPLRSRVVPSLIWLMLATTLGKGGAAPYALREADVAFILGCVDALAKCPAPSRRRAANADARAPPTSTMSLALLARAAYGGMAGDVAILQAEAATVAPVEQTAQAAGVACIHGYKQLPRLAPGEWLPEGVDFHCQHGRIIKLMRQRGTAPSDAALEAWMWRTRSSVNFRDVRRPKQPAPDWDAAVAAAASAAAGKMIDDAHPATRAAAAPRPPA